MPRIYIENGVDRGKSFVIRKGSPFLAGRDTAAQVPLQDEMISRRQFQIEFREEQFFIRDLDSSNGTFLNGSLVKRPEALAPNDRIQVGNTLITFQDDQPHPLIGREVSGYRILDRVGRGGMGTVYRALQLSLDRIVALKVLAPHLAANVSFVNLFIREARAAGALSHPNIVQVYDVGVQEEIYFFSMEYIPDGSVEDLLNRKGPLPLARTLQVAHDAARGLEYAERVGIVHRDIKPGNLMVGVGGRVKIGDLGISRATGEEGQVSQQDGVSGSPHYIAPEQARGLAIDGRVDIYSLGISCYQMLCGSTPFHGATPRAVILKHIKESPPPLPARVQGLPDDVSQLIAHMMERDPAQRVASASQLLEAISPLLAKYGDAGTTVSTSTRFGIRRLASLLFVVCTLVAAGVGGAYWYVTDQSRKRAAASREGSIAKRIGDLARALDAHQWQEIDALVTELTSEELSPVQTGELLRARQALDGHRLEQQRVRLEQQAEIARQSLAATLEAAISRTMTADTRITELRGFADEFRELAARFAGTPAAALAEEEAARLSATAQQTEHREHEAQRELDRLVPLVEGRLRGGRGQFRAALGLLDEFPVDRFADTNAHIQYLEMRLDLRGREEAAWNELQQALRQRVVEHEYDRALLDLDSFRKRTAFATTQELIDRERSHLVELARSSVTGAEAGALSRERTALARTLLNAWQSLLSEFTIDDCILDLDTVQIGLTSPALKDLTSAHAKFIEGWPAVFRILQRKSHGKLERFSLVPVGSDDPLEVEEVRLQEQRVRYSVSGARGSKKWAELSSDTKARLILAVSEEPVELLYAGLLAHVSGLATEGDRAWARAQESEASMQPQIASLRSLVEIARSASSPTLDDR